MKSKLHSCAARTAVLSVLGVFTWAGLSPAVLALVPPPPSGLEPVIRPPVWILEEPDGGMGQAAAAAAGPLARFHEKAGGSWATPLDARTGRALLFQGSGIPLAPGAGNHLVKAAIPDGLLGEAGRPTLEGYAALARGFLEEHGELFLPARGELVLNSNRSSVLEGGRLAYADFDWMVDGVPVLGARVFVRINSGNLVQAGTRLIGTMNAPTRPALTAAEALGRARVWSGLPAEGSTVIEPGRLALLPVSKDHAAYAGPAGEGVEYRLVWEVAFRQEGQFPTWTSRVDATTGDIVEFYDANMYLGQVTGGVFPRTVVDPETVWPFPFATVIGPAPIVADVNGRYPASGAAVSAGLDGRFFDTTCIGCSNPPQPAVGRPLGAGLLSFGTGGIDTAGNGMSSRADRNAFYHLNIVRLVAKKWLANSYLETKMIANVNINSSCNAYYDGNVNFFRSSGSCNNTGEISDVMQHEWGHGLDFATFGGDGATSEATADTTAVHVTHSPLVGPYFNRNGNPVRNLDKATTGKGLLTVANVASKCPGGSGPLGRETHCEGEIYGQTTWDLATALVAKYGANTGWRETERLFFTSLPQSGIYLANQSGSIYDAYIVADDDDGNLANGTPNGAEIHAAFNLHGIAGVPRASSPHCARPAQAAVTAAPGCDQISLSWPAVPGAASYRVQKHWQTGASPFLPVATVAGTSYVDPQVTAGVTYRYVVQTVDASGCESSINVETAASPAARPSIDAVSVVADDTPAGNRSGTIDPGESIDLTITLQNIGALPAGSVTNVLTTSTPGVTITTGSASYPVLAPGSVSPGAPAYRIAIDPSVPCGTPIDLTLSPTDPASGCPLDTIPIRLVTGVEGSVRANYDFEISGGWIQDSATSDATAGSWARGNPVGTSFQPDDDTTASGVTCWYTAANSSEDNGDVDAGQVVLRSPQINLTGLSTAHMSYWRWFGQRDLGDDPGGDFFAVEGSNNGGASWVPIETLGDDVNAAGWEKKDFAVESYLPLTSTMRFRFRVSDGAGEADTIEGAIDDFRIADQTCDTTPPCFIPAAFDGIAAAAPGASCGETSLSWAAAQSQCQNATIRYNVYRGASPGFVPGPENRIATGLAGTSYVDRFLPPGGGFSYIVRAEDSRSGEETNTAVRSAVASSGADVSPPGFSGISAASGGPACGETALSWDGAQESCSLPVLYRVHRSTIAGFTPSPATLVAETASLSYLDPALVPGSSYHYIVRAIDLSGNEEANLVRRTLVAGGTPGACSGCSMQGPVGTIFLTRSGTDVVLDWTADPVAASRYVAYKVTGPTFSQPTRLGATTARSFVHAQGAATPTPVFYFVSAVNTCGQESAFDTEP